MFTMEELEDFGDFAMENVTKKRRTEYHVSAQQVVEIWQTSDSVAEAAERLKMPEPILLARISNYRAKNIQLKKMPRKNVGVNVEKLNKLIYELAQKRA